MAPPSAIEPQSGDAQRLNTSAPLEPGLDEELGKKNGAPKGETIKKYTQDLILLGRTSVPNDVASLVSFLGSKDSDYMTGQT